MLFVFDTHIANRLEAKLPAERRAFWGSLYKTDSYAVCPLVVFEKLDSLRYGSPEKHMPAIRRELYALRGPEPPRVFPVPRIFLAQTVLGLAQEHPVAPAHVLSTLLEVAHKKTSHIWYERATGEAWIFPSRRTRKGFRLAEMLRIMKEGQESMFASIASAWSSNDFPSPDEWARDAVAQTVLPNDAEACRKLATACRAAYNFQIYVWKQAPAGYNPEKEGNRGDWIDQQLLLYLADPSVVLVSNDRRLRDRIGACGQEDQVWTFDEVWTRHGPGSDDPPKQPARFRSGALGSHRVQARRPLRLCHPPLER
jgi:hypothetical protein